MNKEISIIIVNWNTRDLTLTCIKSIAQSSIRQPLEIIVVDNASSDGSVQAIEKDFPEAVIIQNERNEGFSKAVNKGIRQSKGRCICLVNSDMVVESNVLELMFDYLINNPSVGILGPRMVNPNGSVDRTFWKLPSLKASFFSAFGFHWIFKSSLFFNPDYEYAGIENQITDVDVLAGGFWMVLRGTIDKVGLLDENFFFYGEDFDYCKRIKDNGFRTVYFPRAQVTHLGGASSNTKPFLYYCLHKSARLAYWRKHHGVIQSLLIRMLFIVKEVLALIYSAGMIAGRSSRANAIKKLKQKGICIKWLILDSFFNNFASR